MNVLQVVSASAFSSLAWLGAQAANVAPGSSISDLAAGGGTVGLIAVLAWVIRQQQVEKQALIARLEKTQNDYITSMAGHLEAVNKIANRIGDLPCSRKEGKED